MDYKTEIGIKSGQLEAYEKMLGYGEKELIDNGLPRCDNIKTWTGKFADGCEVDVKINSSEDDVWTEAVLFDEGGSELAHTEVCDTIRGDWHFSINGDEYTVVVKEMA